ncbi:MAG: hypothetical protein ACRD1Y_04645 [Terriglobales bacterium]
MAGVAGTAAMDEYWRILRKTKPEWVKSEEEPTSHKVVRRAMQKAGVRSPSRAVRESGGKAVHWTYGAGWGMVVGVSRAAGVPFTWGGGLAFGAGLWALSDEWMLYKLELAKHPKEYPMRTHATALGAHLVYGVGVWAAMKALGGLAGGKKHGFLRRAA